MNASPTDYYTSPPTVQTAYDAARTAGYFPVPYRRDALGLDFPFNSTGGYQPPQYVEIPAGTEYMGIRVPDDVISIDIDNHDAGYGEPAKHGLKHLIDFMESNGLPPLPPTYRITARGPDDAGKQLYRTDAYGEDALPVTKLVGRDVDIISRWHKFVAGVPGTVHHKTGTVIECYGPDDQPCPLPAVDDLPYLPAAWEIALTREPDDGGEAWDMTYPAEGDRCCAYLTRKLADPAHPGHTAPTGGTMQKAVSHVLKLGAEGHYIGPALTALSARSGDPGKFAAMVRRLGRLTTVVVAKAEPVSALEAFADQRPGINCNCLPTPDAGILAGTVVPGYVTNYQSESQSQASLDDIVPALDSRGIKGLHAAAVAIEGSTRGICCYTDAGATLIIDLHLGTWTDLDHRVLVEAIGRKMPYYDPKYVEPGTDRSKDAEEQAEEGNKLRAQLLTNRGQTEVATQMKLYTCGSGRMIREEEIDADPGVLWAGGKCIDLMTGAELADRNEPHRKSAYCAPVPGEYPKFMNLLEAVWPDPDIRQWALTEIAGVALWGSTSKQHPVLDGPPGAGKSTLMESIHKLLGTYAVQCDPAKLLTGRSDTAAEEERRRMLGARFVWLDEPPAGNKQAVSALNDLMSGTGTFTANIKYKDAATVRKTFNFVVCQNARNRLRMDAQGVSERTVLIPCDGTTDPEKMKAVRQGWWDAFSAEAPAVLHLLISACGIYQAGRLPVPAAAAARQAEIRASGDDFGAWIAENYVQVTDPGFALVTLDNLRGAYNEVARSNHQPVLGREEVRDRLAKLGISVLPRETTGAKRRNLVMLGHEPVAM